MDIERRKHDGEQPNFWLTLWHHAKEAPWHVLSYLLLIFTFAGTYWLLKIVINLYKQLDSPNQEGALKSALGIIGTFLLIQVLLNIWTWATISQKFVERRIDTKIVDAKSLLDAHVNALTEATERARDLIPVFNGKRWLQAEVDVGIQEAEWTWQILVVAPDLAYETGKVDRYYKAIVDNLNIEKKPKFIGYIYILPDDAPVRQIWSELGIRLRADPDFDKFDIDRLKCYFYGKHELTLRLSMHGLLIFKAPLISQSIAYQYLPPGSDQEYMNIIIRGADASSSDVLVRCIESLDQFVLNAKTVSV